MPLLDCINQISKCYTCTCGGKPAGLFSHMTFDIERELLLLQLCEKNAVLANLSRRPGYRQITEIQRLDVLKQVHVLLTCYVVLDVMTDKFILSQHVFGSLAVKITNLRQGDHG